MHVATPVQPVRTVTPLERLELLCDEGSLERIRSSVLSPALNGRSTPGDGVVGGLGRVGGRPVACYAQDFGFLGGSLGASHADTIGRVLELAERSRMPVVAFIESSGARVQEGLAALGGYGRIFRRNVRLAGLVPQISVIDGVAAGGACYSPALTDFVVMTEQSSMFLTGPRVVREAIGEDVSASELGGHRVHTRNGVCDLVVPDVAAAAGAARRLLGYLPRHVGAALPEALPSPAEIDDPGIAVPSDPRLVYDVRDALAGIADDGSLLEIAPRWARGIVTSFGRIEGCTVGLIANQPKHKGGVLDTDSSQKGARFVELCDRYRIPLAVLVDTPGFMPGTHQEHAGAIRLGATLLRAFAAATTPRVTVVVRKAFGGAYITMNSKDLGADLALAWPGAELGVMSAQAAVGIVNRRELESAADPGTTRDRLAAAYAERHLSAAQAAARGFIDEVIEPRETRARLASAFHARGPTAYD